MTKTSNIVWFVTLRAIDVESAQITREVPIELKGKISELLPAGIKAASRRILKGSDRQAELLAPSA